MSAAVTQPAPEALITWLMTADDAVRFITMMVAPCCVSDSGLIDARDDPAPHAARRANVWVPAASPVTLPDSDVPKPAPFVTVSSYMPNWPWSTPSTWILVWTVLPPAATPAVFVQIATSVNEAVTTASVLNVGIWASVTFDANEAVNTCSGCAVPVTTVVLPPPLPEAVEAMVRVPPGPVSVNVMFEPATRTRALTSCASGARSRYEP